MKDLDNIKNCIEKYFKGTHQADIALIKEAFHPDCKITGFVGTQYVEMTLTQFCERVKQVQNPLDRKYDKAIIGFDIHENIAMVKAKVLVDDVYFTDYITLLKIDNSWVIRQKSFSSS